VWNSLGVPPTGAAGEMWRLSLESLANGGGVTGISAYSLPEELSQEVGCTWCHNAAHSACVIDANAGMVRGDLFGMVSAKLCLPLCRQCLTELRKGLRLATH
jgi:hypothetical protein